MQGIAKSCALVSLASAISAILALRGGWRFLNVDGSDPVTVRNYFASMAVSDETATHLLFIDSDMQVLASTVTELLAADKDVIGAIYSRRDGTGEFVFKPTGAPAVSGLIPGRAIGMGLTLIKTSALKKMISLGLTSRTPKAFIGAEKVAMQRGFFDLMDEDGGILSEDFSFCKRWIEQCDGKVWGLPTDKVGHVGDFAYRGLYKLPS
jgi:hypothetical protein